MELRDSKKEKLSYNQVLLGAVQNMKSSGQIPDNVTMQQAMTTVVGEIGIKNVQTVQIGNSIFVGTFTPKKNNMYVRVYNMDVGRNLIDNMYNYAAFLQKKGVAFASAYIEDERLLPGLRVLQRRLEEKGTGLDVVELETGDGFGMFIKFGKQSLRKAA
ncbi:MAG: hypothetical protein CBC71_05740 [Rhodobacteraceae bacterium TMED111]|nr:MAG: hypothetical protein CBC71_05740 [Rhodobacteraceae bacterium TMED111]|tara:strand:+ start:8762 stop:9238 length:477 start_codon:yes stop_codon:yes gene_type:complete